MDQGIQGLKAERVQKDLLELPGWQMATSGATTVEWRQTFSTFNRIVEILVDIAVWAVRAGRTPDISVRGNELTVRLGMDGLTEADLDLAKEISSFV